MNNTQILTAEQRSTLRKALLNSGVPTRGLDDNTIIEVAKNTSPSGELKKALETLAGTRSSSPTVFWDTKPETTPWYPKAFDDEPEPVPIGAEPEPASSASAEPEPAPSANTQDVAAAIHAAIHAAIQAALQTVQTPSAAVDEQQLVKLIKQHASVTHTVTVRKPDTAAATTIVGAHSMLPKVLSATAAGMHVYLVGPAGSGKTHLIRQVAEALDRKAYVTGALLTKFELTGYMTASGEYVRTAFRDAVEHGGVFGFDEMDASAPAALVAFNAALSNSHYQFPDKEIEIHPDFVCIGAANTVGTGATRAYVGRNPLDGATLDRFVQVELGYDESLEDRLTREAWLIHGGDEQSDIPSRWLTLVREFRTKIAHAGLPVIISPRASIQGVKLLTSEHWTLQDVAEATLHKHLSKDQREQLGVPEKQS